MLSGAFITILNQTLLGTALPPIMKDLNLSESTAQWLQSGFILINGIMIPITAFLIDRFSTRKLFLTAMSLFSLGTLIAAVAPDFSFLMTGRILQASGAGIMMPLMQTILFLLFPVEKRGTAMGLIGLITKVSCYRRNIAIFLKSYYLNVHVATILKKHLTYKGVV